MTVSIGSMAGRQFGVVVREKHLDVPVSAEVSVTAEFLDMSDVWGAEVCDFCTSVLRTKLGKDRNEICAFVLNIGVTV